MYEISIINNNVGTVINALSTSFNSPRITGTIKKGINVIDNFTFNILPNNPGYNLLKQYKTLVNVYNTKTGVFEFQGRVLLSKHSMSSTGEISKSVICESELGYLHDSHQRYGEYHNISVKDFLKLILDNHNSQVSADKRFVLGNVTVRDNNDSLYRFLGYDDTFETIKDKLISRLGGEFQIRHENGIRYLDYLSNIGHTSEVQIRLAKNLKTITESKDPSEIATRLIPLGIKINNSEKRLDIKSVNSGRDYLDDYLAQEEFGIIEKTVIFDDVTEASNLIRKGRENLSANRIRKQYLISALDLYTIGLDTESIDLYNYYQVINPLMNINEHLRVIEKTIDINNPQNTEFTIGDKFEDIKNYQISTKKESTLTKNKADESYKIAERNVTEIQATNNTVDILNQNLDSANKQIERQRKFIIMGV